METKDDFVEDTTLQLRVRDFLRGVCTTLLDASDVDSCFDIPEGGDAVTQFIRCSESATLYAHKLESGEGMESTSG